MPAQVPFLRLVAAEARALPRARFALAGAAVLAALLLALGTLMIPSMEGLWSFATLVYGLAPALLAAVAAAQVASLRTTRLGQALYTCPVRSGQVLAARLTVSLGLAVAFFAAPLPFLGVAALHVNIPSHVLGFVGLGAGILLFAVAFGTMLGVLFAGRSLAAPATLAAGFMLVSFFALPQAWQAAQSPHGADALLMQALHASPHLLLNDATGLMAGSAGVAASKPGLALALFAAQTLACLAIAAWAYTRAQGPEGWEVAPARRAVLAALALAILLAPAAVADASYERLPGPHSFGGGWWSEAHNATAVLAAPGTTPSLQTPLLGTGDAPLEAGTPNRRDLILLVAAEPGQALRRIRFTVEGAGGIVPAERFDLDGGSSEISPRPEGGTVVRVALTLVPPMAQNLAHNYHALWVNVTYWLEGEDREREARVASAVRADVPGARLQLALAGAPSALLAVVAAVMRRVRVGA